MVGCISPGSPLYLPCTPPVSPLYLRRYVLAYVVGCCGRTPLVGLWLGLIGGYMVTTALASGAVLLGPDWAVLERVESAVCLV